MSEMCQDLAAKSHEKLMINYFTDITLYGGGTNLQVSLQLFLINKKVEKIKVERSIIVSLHSFLKIRKYWKFLKK